MDRKSLHKPPLFKGSSPTLAHEIDTEGLGMALSLAARLCLVAAAWIVSDEDWERIRLHEKQ